MTAVVRCGLLFALLSAAATARADLDVAVDRCTGLDADELARRLATELVTSPAAAQGEARAVALECDGGRMLIRVLGPEGRPLRTRAIAAPPTGPSRNQLVAIAAAETIRSLDADGKTGRARPRPRVETGLSAGFARRGELDAWTFSARAGARLGAWRPSLEAGTARWLGAAPEGAVRAVDLHAGASLARVLWAGDRWTLQARASVRGFVLRATGIPRTPGLAGETLSGGGVDVGAGLEASVALGAGIALALDAGGWLREPTLRGALTGGGDIRFDGALGAVALWVEYAF